MADPEISIITISFNNIEGLKSSLNSVANQSFKNFEHWVIDGNSSDGSKAFLDAYQSHPIQYISEPDKGIYDAMNKGITRATGKWIIFLNSGDSFHDNNLLDQINFEAQDSVVYGSSKVHYQNGFSRIMNPRSLDEMWKEMTFSHQAVFLKTDLAKSNLFNTAYKICADFDQLFKLYLEGTNFREVDAIIANVEAGGVSDSKRYKATREVYRINKKRAPKFRIHFYFIIKIIKGYLAVKIKAILPKKTVSKLTEKKYQ